MCCDKALEAKVRLIGMGTLIGSLAVIVFLQSMLVFCASVTSQEKINNFELHKSNKTSNCNIKLDHKHEYSYTVPISAITVFLVLLDIPSSAVLLIGTSLKLKYNLVPWLALNGVKMIIIVIVFSIVVWCTYAYVNSTGVVRFKFGTLAAYPRRPESFTR